MAYLLPSHKLIFIHIYKTGGMALRDTLPLGGIEVAGAHAPATFVRKAMEPDIHLWDSCSRFAVIRNPFDWMVSLYHHITRSSNNWVHNHVKVTSLEALLSWMKDEGMEIPPMSNGHCLGTLSRFILDENDEPLVTHLLRFERLEEDTQILFRAFGIPYKLRSVNVSHNRQRRDYQSYYNATTKKLVQDIFGEDLERFKYQF